MTARERAAARWPQRLRVAVRRCDVCGFTETLTGTQATMRVTQDAIEASQGRSTPCPMRCGGNMRR
jgi:hypothetical protein